MQLLAVPSCQSSCRARILSPSRATRPEGKWRRRFGGGEQNAPEASAFKPEGASAAAGAVQFSPCPSSAYPRAVRQRRRNSTGRGSKPRAHIVACRGRTNRANGPRAHDKQAAADEERWGGCSRDEGEATATYPTLSVHLRGRVQRGTARQLDATRPQEAIEVVDDDDGGSRLDSELGWREYGERVRPEFKVLPGESGGGPACLHRPGSQAPYLIAAGDARKLPGKGAGALAALMRL